MARYHLPARIPPRVKPSRATRRRFDAVMALLSSASAEPMSSDEMLAERERLGVEADAQRHRQGELVLRGKA